MCNFFTFVTDPINHPAEYYYFDWQYRKANLNDGGVDSHSHVCAYFKLDEDRCNKYEYNPLLGKFEVDQINSERDDSEAAEKWARRLDFKTVVEPLVIKPIMNPLELPEVTEVTAEHIQWLHEWASVRVSVRASVWASVWDSAWDSAWGWVWASVGDSVWDSGWDSVGDLVMASVRASVWAYISSFFAIDYEFNFSSAVKLWESGLVPSYDGQVWRLHTGKDAKIVYEEAVK